MKKRLSFSGRADDWVAGVACGMKPTSFSVCRCQSFSPKGPRHAACFVTCFLDPAPLWSTLFERGNVKCILELIQLCAQVNSRRKSVSLFDLEVGQVVWLCLQ